MPGDEQLPCHGCGYDLRGLPAEGSCPECETPIERSLRGDRLAESDAGWLATVCRGQGLVAFGLFLSLATWLLFFVFTVTVGLLISGLVANPAPFQKVASIVMNTGVLGGMVIAAVGALLLTMLEPRETLREGAASTRNLARYGLVAAIALITIDRLLPPMLPPAAVPIVGGVTILLFAAAATIAIVNILRWLSSLAARIPDPELVKRTDSSIGILRWVIMAFVIAGVARPFLPKGQSTAAKTVDIFGTIVIVVLGLLLLAQIGGLVKTMRWHRRGLLKCLSEASGDERV